MVQRDDPAADSTTTRLRPTFRKRDGVALIVSNVVGVGIFTTPCVVASLVPDSIGMLAVWIVGGALALAGAASYARLAELWPQAGGEYVYLTKSYGPAAGFLSGWTSLIAGFSGSIAANAVAAVLFAGQYFPKLASDRLLSSQEIFGLQIGLSSRAFAAALIIAGFAILHIFSLAAGKNIQSLLAVLLVGMVVILVAAGFIVGHGSWSHFRPSASLASPSHFAGMNWLLALIPVMFTYSGWNAAVYVSEEVRASRRSMRLILLAGTAVVIVLYIALNALYLFAVTPAEMHSVPNVAETAAKALFGLKASLTTPLIILALLGAVSAMTIAGPRVYFAMARDGTSLPALARIHPRFQTPVLAIALQAAWSIALVLVGGFEQILMYTGFAVVLSSGAAVASLFFVRGQPVGRRRWREFAIPAIFVVSCVAMVVDTILGAPRIALMGVLLIAAGLPAYALFRRRKSVPCGFQPEEVAGD
jgi:APA family basic amino acid/polyamine antiporter